MPVLQPLGKLNGFSSVVSRVLLGSEHLQMSTAGRGFMSYGANNQVVGTPLNIIFIKTFDSWGNAYALMQSEKSGIQFQGLNTIQVHKVTS